MVGNHLGILKPKRVGYHESSQCKSCGMSKLITYENQTIEVSDRLFEFMEQVKATVSQSQRSAKPTAEKRRIYQHKVEINGDFNVSSSIFI